MHSDIPALRMQLKTPETTHAAMRRKSAEEPQTEVAESPRRTQQPSTPRRRSPKHPSLSLLTSQRRSDSIHLLLRRQLRRTPQTRIRPKLRIPLLQRQPANNLAAK